MIQKNLLSLGEQKKEEVYPSSLWQRLKKYFGGNSTGVRNWLLIVGLLTFAILLLLGPAAPAALTAAALLGLLITAAVIASISVLATLVALINSIKADYIEYKRLQLQDSYFLSLVLKFKAWALDHKFEVFMMILCFIPLFVGIPTLIGAPALAIFASIALALSGAIMIDGAWRLIEYLYDSIPSTTLTHRLQSMVKAANFTGNSVSMVIDTGLTTDITSFYTTNKELIESFFNKTCFSNFFNFISLGDTSTLHVSKNKITNFIESFEYSDSNSIIRFERKENHQVNTETLKYSVYHDTDLYQEELLLHVIVDLKTNRSEFIVDKIDFKTNKNILSQTNVTVTVEEPSSDSEGEDNVNISSKPNYQLIGLNPVKSF